MTDSAQLKDLEKRILAALQSQPSEWFSRSEITRRLGRPGAVHPGDIAALDRLTLLGLIEAQTEVRGLAALRWVYRVKE